LDPDFGLGFVGGVWLVREYLQPVAEIVWSRSVAGALSIDGVRLGLGLAAGAPVYDKRVWIGAEIIPHAMWTRIEDQQTIGTWTSSTEVAARVQYRHGWLYVGGRLGVDLTFPAIRATGENDRMRWGNLRFVAGVEIGVVIPGRKTSR
jgi:hypothetical protein